jgi:hypothetical protein
MNITAVVILASDWVKEQVQYIATHGRPLSVQESAVARKVGVKNIAQVKILEVDLIEPPKNPILNELCQELEFLSDATIGLTMFNCIFIKKGHYSTKLLSHELRHVYQYQQFGSVEAFLSEYIRQIMSVGYEDSELEIDARNHELIS